MSCASTAPPLDEARSAVGVEPRFTTFESDQVRPLALSPNGKRLFAVNTPDNRVEIFSVKPGGLVHETDVVVGLEPVAVGALSNDELWVVNQLSDSVSIVRLEAVNGHTVARVVRTLLVGDEPRDVVFAGPNRKRAFITAAHRGQNAPFDPQLTEPGVGRADVWVFDTTNLGTSLGGNPIAIVNLFADKPRALAVSPDGKRVYAAGYMTGNQTSIGFATNVPQQLPATNHAGSPTPFLGSIVKWNGTHWLDDTGNILDDSIKFNLPDKDVFVIDASASSPAVVSAFANVGTVLFNLAVNPASGRVYASNLDANNLQRFSGPGTFWGSTLRGKLSQSRITVLDPGGAVTPRHLNKHIDYDTCCDTLPNTENARSLAFPQSMAITANGQTMYVAALGSDKIGVFNTGQLENDTFVPNAASHIEVSGGGPTGIVLDEARRQIYVMTRFDNGIKIVSTATRREVGNVRLFNPEPPKVVEGRRFLYDASFSSSHGDSACASCHIFADFDGLAWDLGDPDDNVVENPGPFGNIPTSAPREFHPMKGPMVTQSLRGMANHGQMHWRGDKTGGYNEPSEQPDNGSFDEDAAFKQFNPAFVGLMGRDQPIGNNEMQAFANFILEVTYPPNPVRNLDNSLTASQQAGRDLFMIPKTTFIRPANPPTTCIACHLLDPTANAGLTDHPGLFGTDGQITDVNGSFLTKNPHLRNMYQKVGMFGMPANPVFPSANGNAHMGDQVRGFGFSHDGAVDTLSRFVDGLGFTQAPDHPEGIPTGAPGDPMRRALDDFMLAFDSNMAPIVGQQTTLMRGNVPVVSPRINLLKSRASAGECELVAKMHLPRGEAGWLFDGASFVPDRAGGPHVSEQALRNLALLSGHELTYTCVPNGSGRRIAIDADLDGFLDGDELVAGSDRRDPASTP